MKQDPTVEEVINYWTWLGHKWKALVSTGIVAGLQAIGSIVEHSGIVSPDHVISGLKADQALRMALHLFQLLVVLALLLFLQFAPGPLDSESNKEANTAVREFYRRWKAVWMFWAVLYIGFFFKEWLAPAGAGTGAWFWVLLNLLNNLQSVVIIHSYFGLFRRPAFREMLGFGVTLAVVFTCLEVGYLLSSSGSGRKTDLDVPTRSSSLNPGPVNNDIATHGDDVARDANHEPLDRAEEESAGGEHTKPALGTSTTGITFWFRVVTGIVGGLALIFLSERLASGFMTTPRLVVALLYAYGLIQAMWGAFADNAGLETALTSLALAFKVLLFSVVYWVVSSGLLLFYLVKMRELDGHAPEGLDPGLGRIDALRVIFIQRVRAERAGPIAVKARNETNDHPAE